MKEEKRTMNTIRGVRNSVMFIKTVKGLPGFAPESYDSEVGEVVYNFPHNEKNVYFQAQDNMPILEKEDVEQILLAMTNPLSQ